MTNTDLVCDFLTNPFGDEQKARELLSELEHRALSDAELERGLFCFQIAFYFLACLAISSHVRDSSLQKRSIDQLHERVRAFYARKGSEDNFSKFVVSPAERDRFIAVLGGQLEQAAESGVTAPPATTMLALFDFVVVQRLREYLAAISQSNRARKLNLVAEQVLFHYGAKDYRAAAVDVIADLLLVNYNTVCAIVISGVRADAQPRTEDEDAVMPIPLSPRMPDVTAQRPAKIYLAGTYAMSLVANVGSIGGSAPIRYRYVLAVCDRRRSVPVCFVTLEDSMSVSNVLGVFEQDGSHSNYGTLRGPDFLQEFVRKGMELIRYRFNPGEIVELLPRSQRQARWKFWQADGTTSQAAAQSAA